MVALAATFVVGAANVKIWERLNRALDAAAVRGSAAALGAGDERREAEQKLLPARADDPEDAELPQVLELLGARVDDG